MQTWKTGFSSRSETIIMGRSNTERWAWVTCFSLLSGWNSSLTVKSIKKINETHKKISTQWNVWNAQKRKLSTASAHQLILQFQLLFLLCTGLHNCTTVQVHNCNCTTARPGEARYATEFANKVFSPQNMELTEKRRRQRFFSRFWNISTIEHIAMHERGFYARCKMSDGFCYLSLFLLLECSF